MEVGLVVKTPARSVDGSEEAVVVALADSRTDDALIRQVADQSDSQALEALVQRYDARLQHYFGIYVDDARRATRLATLLWRRFVASVDAYDVRQGPAQFLESIAVNLIRDHSLSGDVFSTAADSGDNRTNVAELADLDPDVVDGLARQLGSVMVPSLPVDERIAFLLREEGRVWPEKVSLTWAQLADLNGVDPVSAWSEFDECRRQLINSPARLAQMPQAVGLLLVWSQSQAPHVAGTADYADLARMLGTSSAEAKERCSRAVARLVSAMSAQLDQSRADSVVGSEFLIALYRHYRAFNQTSSEAVGNAGSVNLVDLELSGTTLTSAERLSDVREACATELKARRKNVHAEFVDSSHAGEDTPGATSQFLSKVSGIDLRYREAWLGIGLASVVAVLLLVGFGSEVKGQKDLARSLGVTSFSAVLEDRTATADLSVEPSPRTHAERGVPEYTLGRISGELVLAVAANTPDTVVTRLAYLNHAVRQLPASTDIGDVGSRTAALTEVVRRWRETDIAVNANVRFRLRETVDATASAAAASNHAVYFQIGAWMSLTRHLASSKRADPALLNSAYAEGIDLLQGVPFGTHPDVDAAIAAYHVLDATHHSRALHLRSALSRLDDALGNGAR